MPWRGKKEKPKGGAKQGKGRQERSNERGKGKGNSKLKHGKIKGGGQ